MPEVTRRRLTANPAVPLVSLELFKIVQPVQDDILARLFDFACQEDLIEDGVNLARAGGQCGDVCREQLTLTL